jgi:hypothetical protein
LSKLVWDHVLDTYEYMNAVNGSCVLWTLFHELLMMERKFDWFQTLGNRFKFSLHQINSMYIFIRKIITLLKHVRSMKLKTSNFVMYLYKLLAKGLKEITCTQYFIIIQTSIVIKL